MSSKSFPLRVIVGLPLELQSRILSLLVHDVSRSGALDKILDAIHEGPLRRVLVSLVHTITIRSTESSTVQCNLDPHINESYLSLFRRYPEITTLVILPGDSSSQDLAITHPSLFYFLATQVKYIENYDLSTVCIYQKQRFRSKLTKIHYEYDSRIYLGELTSMENLELLHCDIFSQLMVNYHSLFKWIQSAPQTNRKLRFLSVNINPTGLIGGNFDPYDSFIIQYKEFESRHKNFTSFLDFTVPYMQLLSPISSLERHLTRWRCQTVELKCSSNTEEILQDFVILQSLPSLTHLSLHFPIHPLTILSTFNLELPKLKSLILKYCNNYLSPNFVYLSQLRSFKVYQSSLTRETIQLPASLQVLELSNTRISLDLSQLPTNISDLSLLNVQNLNPTVLDLHNHTRLSKIIFQTHNKLLLKSLPSSLESLTLFNIRQLKIINASVFGHCSNLRTISIKTEAPSDFDRLVSKCIWPDSLRQLSIKVFQTAELRNLPDKLRTLSIDFPKGSTQNYLFLGFAEHEMFFRKKELLEYEINLDDPNTITLYIDRIPMSIEDVETWGDFAVPYSDDSSSDSLVITGANDFVQDNQKTTKLSVILRNQMVDLHFSILDDATELFWLRELKKKKI
ncbi:hypothetical protein FOA43_000967 [Brettanomyces nanus]|uniref:Uncharacterized protein n=1 Tax=Eeniella nana TaxID=13502 RepID=A0A875S2U4_EENNA|nr:uncharacterized protein FOA43_000967 [Brettanomyces nanus]QPG73654.1 hypothetical protein FOA43_000967 [Brettanomyces nanus]